MAKSVKVNFVFNLINTISGLLFPLITFPYASRVIMSEGIGQVNFYTSIINYIALFSCIGIPLYGIREIARVRDSQVDLSRTTVEILLLNTKKSGIFACTRATVKQIIATAKYPITFNNKLSKSISTVVLLKST